MDINKLHVITESIRSAKEIPSGHLYAICMNHISLEEYNEIIEMLKRINLIEERFFLLKWIGPNIQ